MAQAKVSSQGRITIPAEVRGSLGLRIGDTLMFEAASGGYRIRKRPQGDPFDKWRGFLTHLAGRTTDEIMEEMRLT